MLGSATMLRVLAITYHDLIASADRSLTRAEIVSFFQSIDGRMSEVPIAEDNTFWMSTRSFVPGANAPQARAGSINSLVSALVDRAREHAAAAK